ncbi:hypothetical protein BKA61DRAFT_705538 [Leptodontidium sp. MPI-SDFR-AT-0119]|nr:hypothetical protein BKA61DRAFT_705538 [Leptodontidium sp. MPI-SDFR-AT-0119]
MITITRGGSPILYLDSGTSSANALTLSAGSVWIPAQQFVPTTSSAANTFVALSITGGNVTFNGNVNTAASLIVLGPNVVMTVNLKFGNSGKPPSGITLQSPATMTFIFDNTGAHLQNAGIANLGVFGSSIGFTFANPNASWDADLGKVVFVGAISLSTLKIINGQREFLQFSSALASIGINNGAWVPDVQSTNPSTVTEASSPGSLALYLKTGLQATLSDSMLSSGLINCGPCTLVAGITELLITGLNLKLPKCIVNLPQSSSVVMRGGSAFQYTSLPNGTDSWTAYSSMTASLNQPRNVRGEGSTLAGIGALVITKVGGLAITTAEVDITADSTVPPASGSYFQSYALKNLFLKGDAPSSLAIQGTLQNSTLISGNYRLFSNLRYVLPFLPDPYVTNIQYGQAIDNSIIGDLVFTGAWEVNAPMTIDVTLPNGTLNRLQALTPATSSATMQAALPTSPSEENSLLGHLNADEIVQPVISLGPTMLDISSNNSQFGVSISAFNPDLPQQPQPTVAHLYMRTAANQLRAFALPQVQWEPVTTPDPVPPVTAVFQFTDSGPATQIGTNSVTLIPVASHEIVSGLAQAYATELTSRIFARFTMPFGIISTASLIKSTIPFFNSPTFGMIQPSFKAINYFGADQVSLGAPQPRFHPIGKSTGPTPSLPGISVLSQFPDSATATAYNEEFGPSKTTAKIPASRVDISGYGLSIFTDWRDDTISSGISQVDLQAIVGRTEREVIVQKMELLYSGAPATRTVVIQRLNSGEMRRQVFLKATGPGTFNFNDAAIKPKTHQGLVQQVINIRNMREVADIPYTTTDSTVNPARVTTFFPIQYDCDVVIQPTPSSPAIQVPAINHRGYLAAPLATNGKMMLSDFVSFLGQLPNKNLMLGGPIDCTVKAGNLTVKLTSITVDSTLNATTNASEIVIAPLGIPEFAGHGEWSMVQKVGPLAPMHLDNTSVPVIRQNTDAATGSPVKPLRFANPADLLSAVPGVDYCIMHNADTVRTLFPRPKIEDDGLNQISSVLSPVIADPYAMGNCSGIFPDLTACIPLQLLGGTELSNVTLPVDPSGFMSLLNPQATDPANPGQFPSPIAAVNRVLRGGDFPTLTAMNTGAITLLINSVDPDAAKAFNFASKAVKLLSFDGKNQIDPTNAVDQGLNKLLEVAGDALSQAKSDLKPLIDETNMVLGEIMQPVKKVLAFLATLGPLPKLDVHMDADFTVHVSLTFNLETYLESMLPPVAAVIAEFVTQFDFNINHTQQLLTHNTKFGVKPIFKIPTPFAPAIAVATATFDAAFENGVPSIAFGLGAGIGVDFGIGPFSATGYVLITQTIMDGGGSFGIGTDILVKASVNLFDLIKADVVVETSVKLLAVTCHPELKPGDSGFPETPTIWGIAQTYERNCADS